MQSNKTQLQFINAICNVDFHKIRTLLDDEILHYGTTKDIFMKELIYMLAGLKEIYDGDVFYQNKWQCKFGIDLNCNCDTKHANPVRFQVGTAYFIWNLIETKNGKFTIETCHSRSKDEYLVPFGIMIPHDLLVNFEPDSGYLSFELENQKTLAPMEKGDILLWTKEDLEKWLICNKKVIQLSNEYKSYSAFCSSWEFFKYCITLGIGMNNEELCKKANIEFSRIDRDNAYSNWLFVRKYLRYEITNIALSNFDLDKVDEGYFTFSHFYKNLRFEYPSHEQFIIFVQNYRVAMENCGEYNSLMTDIDVILEDMDKPFDEKYIIPEYYSFLNPGIKNDIENINER